MFDSIQIHQGLADITIRQLLSHTAGIRQFWSDEEVFELSNIIPELTGTIIGKRKLFTAWNLSKEPVFPIGEHHYSNAGYVIVAAMLEKISGKSYEELLSERVFIPLNLKSPGFGYPFLKDSTQPHRHMYRDEDGIVYYSPFSRPLVDFS